MFRLRAFIFLLTLSTTVGAQLFAKDGSQEKGEAIFKKLCYNCHDHSGRYSPNPILYGQRKNFIKLSLERFQSGERKDLFNRQMNVITKLLSKKDIDDLANYLSKESPCKNVSAVVAEGDPIKGKLIYERNYCSVCHSEKEAATGPYVMGQKPNFSKTSILAFKNGKRSNPNMFGLVQHLSEENITDVAAYLSTQTRCKE